MHYGIGCDIKIISKNEEDAKLRAESITLEFLTIISYLERCYFDIPLMILKYEYPEKDTRIKNYSAIVVDNSYRPQETSLRLVNISKLKIFLDKLEVLDKEKKSAVMQALHWFWKALGVTDKRDRFLNLWIGLEFLEKQLKKTFQLPTSKYNLPKCPHCKENIDKCPKCGKADPVYKANTGFTGYKKLQELLKGKVLTFDQIHDYRSRLVHGDNLTKEELDNSILSTTVLINLAILTILKMSPDPGINANDAIEMAKGEMRKISLPLMMQFDGEIEVSEIPQVDDIDKQPHVSGDYEFKFEPINENEIITNCDVIHTFHGVFIKGKAKKILKNDASQKVEDVWERV